MGVYGRGKEKNIGIVFIWGMKNIGSFMGGGEHWYCFMGVIWGGRRILVFHGGGRRICIILWGYIGRTFVLMSFSLLCFVVSILIVNLLIIITINGIESEEKKHLWGLPQEKKCTCKPCVFCLLAQAIIKNLILT